jgi:hemoglobin-like flavoprotein
MNIQESIHRILERRDCFADLFYIVFLDEYPEVRQHFVDINLKHQAVLLTMAIMVMERHYSAQYPATRMYLKHLGAKHQKRGIPVNLYPSFRAALLQTLERFHSSDWDTNLASQWRDAIDEGIATMLEAYEDHCALPSEVTSE